MTTVSSDELIVRPPATAASPFVSVCMITFNQADYVREAIDSVLRQRTSFRVELVIGDDASTDATTRIIAEYTAAHPELVRSALSPVNKGIAPNFAATLDRCRGKYVALIDGDDYWTDPLKLQKQAACLDANPGLSMCFHPTATLEDGRVVADAIATNVPEITTIEDLAAGNYMQTSSVMFRRGLFSRWPESFFRSPVEDYFLHMLNAQSGPIRKLPDTMAVYRVHPAGFWSQRQEKSPIILDYLECMVGCFSAPINDLLMARHKRIAARAFLDALDAAGSDQRLERCLRYGPDHLVGELRAVLGTDRGNAFSRLLRRAARRLDGLAAG